MGRLAGLPPAVLARAKEVLALLEGEQLAARLTERDGVAGEARAERGAPPERHDTAGAPTARDRSAAPRRAAAPTEQLALFGAVPHPVVEALKTLDPDAMTPLQALQLLARLVEDARRG